MFPICFILMSHFHMFLLTTMGERICRLLLLFLCLLSHFLLFNLGTFWYGSLILQENLLFLWLRIWFGSEVTLITISISSGIKGCHWRYQFFAVLDFISHQSAHCVLLMIQSFMACLRVCWSESFGSGLLLFFRLMWIFQMAFFLSLVPFGVIRICLRICCLRFLSFLAGLFGS